MLETETLLLCVLEDGKRNVNTNALRKTTKKYYHALLLTILHGLQWFFKWMGKDDCIKRYKNTSQWNCNQHEK